MGMLSFVEDRPTPREVYNWRVYLLAAVASCTSCMIGYDSAYIGTTISLPSFKSEFGFYAMSSSHLSLISENIVSIYQAGAFFGSLIAYPIGFYWGRKIGLWIAGLIFVLGAGIMMGANGERGLGLIYTGRVLAGLAVGMGSNMAPMYISELAPPAIRGRLVGTYELGWQIGGLVGFWICDGVENTLPAGKEQWMIPFAVQLIPGGLFLIGLFFVRESPRWLLSCGRREEGIRNLCWMRQLKEHDIYILEEIHMIDQSLEEQFSGGGRGFWKPFKVAASDKKVLYRLFLGSMLFFWQNGSGINAINYYSPTVFGDLGVEGTNTDLFTTGLFGVVKTVGTCIWILFLIEWVGRRRLLMIGAAGSSVCLWIVGAYIQAANPAKNSSGKMTSGGIAAIFFFYLSTAFYTPTWNGTPWVINSEMFETNVRPLSQTTAACSNWLWTFLISRFTDQMFTAMGAGVWFFFAALMLCSIFFVFILIPETKSIPLERMNHLFDYKPARTAHGRILADLQGEEQQFRQELGVSNEKAQITQVEHTTMEPV